MECGCMDDTLHYFILQLNYIHRHPFTSILVSSFSSEWQYGGKLRRRETEREKALGLELGFCTQGGRAKQIAEMEGSTAAAVTKDVPAEDPKVDVFEDDDEFEEFENEVWDDEDEGKGAVQQWEDDWDDDDVTDDFSVQLKKELEAEK